MPIDVEAANIPTNPDGGGNVIRFHQRFARMSIVASLAVILAFLAVVLWHDACSRKQGRALLEHNGQACGQLVDDILGDLHREMFAPPIIEEKVVGVMGVANKPTDFTQEDARMADAFGRLAAIAHRGILEDGVEFISKPLTRDVLVRKVREVLDG